MSKSEREEFEIILLGFHCPMAQAAEGQINKLAGLLQIPSDNLKKYLGDLPVSLKRFNTADEIERLVDELHTLGVKTKIHNVITSNHQSDQGNAIASESESKNSELVADFNRASDLYRNKDYRRAEDIFRSLAQRFPKLPEVHQNLASTLAAMSRWREASEFYRKALALTPGSFESHLGLGNACNQLGEFNVALQHFSEAQASTKTRVNALFGSGVALYGKKEFQSAQGYFQEVLNSAPDYHAARYNLADCLRQLGDLSGSETVYRKCIERNPEYFEAHCWLAKVLYDQERFIEAKAAFEKAASLRSKTSLLTANVKDALSVFLTPEESLQQHSEHSVLDQAWKYLKSNNFEKAERAFSKECKRAPGNVDALIGLIRVKIVLEKYKQARELLARAELLAPRDPKVLFQRAELLLKGGNNLEAFKVLNEALVVAPELSDTHLHWAHAYLHNGDDFMAEKSFRRALELDPNSLTVLCEMGQLLVRTKRIDEGEEYYRRALSIDGDFAPALNNLATLDFERRNPQRGIEICDRILRAESENHMVRWNRGLLHLLAGNYQQGWKDFESRLESKKLRRKYSQPCWDGTPIKGKTLLINMEQGFGDRIMLARYFHLLRDKGIKIILEKNAALEQLFCLIDGVNSFDPEHIIPNFDYQVDIMSLPALFGTTLETVPNRVPFLSAPGDWQQRGKSFGIGTSGIPKVGFVFKGNKKQGNDEYRSCAVENYLDLFEIPDIEWVCLQKELTLEEEEFLESFRNIKLISRKLKNFADTARIIQNLDLVIAVDTAVAHLSGALGKPVWILLSANSSWQWLLNRSDSPWYPTAKLFRQVELGRWDKPIQELRVEIAKKLTGVKLPESFRPDNLFELGQRYLAQGNTRSALKMADQIIATDGKSPQASFLRAESLRLENRNAECKVEILEGLSLDPQDSSLLVSKGRISRLEGDSETARKALLEAIALNPDDLVASLECLSVLLELADFDVALKFGSSAMKRFPNSCELINAVSAAALNLDNIELCEELNTQSLKLEPNNITTLLISAELSSTKRDYSKARAIIATVVDMATFESEILLRAARILANAQDLSGALALYKQILNVDPLHYKANNECGDLLSKKNELVEALELYLVALQTQPLDLELHDKIYRLQTALNLSDKAQSTQRHLKLAVATRQREDEKQISITLGKERDHVT